MIKGGIIYCNTPKESSNGQSYGYFDECKNLHSEFSGSCQKANILDCNDVLISSKNIEHLKIEGFSEVTLKNCVVKNLKAVNSTLNEINCIISGTI